MALQKATTINFAMQINVVLHALHDGIAMPA